LKIIKSGSAGGAADTELELAAINAFAKTALTAEEIYTFSVLLCDNEVDRDFERFSEQTLEELRELFVGTTGICDHDWKSGGQVARIYRTELLTDPGRKNSQGAPYVYLKGWAYMLRTEGNAELIAQIEGGIRRETSVGCAVAQRICSICGEEAGSAGCCHTPGREYGGKLCYAELQGAVDAYEWSFVAVPAQKNSGVIKQFDRAATLKKFLEGSEGKCFAGELEALEKQAEIGRRYLDGLRREVLRLALLCDRQLHTALKTGAGHMDEAELLELKGAFQARLAETMPLQTQLPGLRETTAFDDGEYRI
jgi:hypothetical protein